MTWLKVAAFRSLPLQRKPYCLCLVAELWLCWHTILSTKAVEIELNLKEMAGAGPDMLPKQAANRRVRGGVLQFDSSLGSSIGHI